MRLIPFLGFSGQAHEAMAFYAKALGGQVTSEMKYRDMPPSDGSPGCNEMPPETLDHVAHSQLEIGSAIVMATVPAVARAARPPSMSTSTASKKPNACSLRWPKVARCRCRSPKRSGHIAGAC